MAYSVGTPTTFSTISGTTTHDETVTVASNGSLVLFLMSSATSGDNHGTPTLGGVAMTQVQTGISGSNRKDTLWYAENVAAGSPTLHCAPSSISNRYSGGFVVITGVKTSGSLDTSNTGTAQTGTSRTGSVTPSVANALTIMINFNLYNAGTNSTKAFGTGDDANLFYNTDAKSAAQFDMTATYTSSQENAYIIAAFKPNGNNYTQSLTESLTLTASIKRQTNKALSASVTLAAAIKRAAGKAVANAVTLTASSSTKFIYSRAYTEAITLTASVARKTFKALTTSVTLTATIKRSAAKAIANSVTLTAAITTVTVYVKSFTEAITLAASSAAKITGKTLGESVSLSDTLDILKTYTRAFTESITLTAAAAKQLGRRLTASITLTASLSKYFVAGRHLVESITLADRIRGVLNGLNMLYSNKYTGKAVTYFKKYLDNK